MAPRPGSFGKGGSSLANEALRAIGSRRAFVLPDSPGPIIGPAASLSIAPTASCAWPLYSGAMRIDRILIGLGVLILLVWAVFTAID